MHYRYIILLLLSLHYSYGHASEPEEFGAFIKQQYSVTELHLQSKDFGDAVISAFIQSPYEPLAIKVKAALYALDRDSEVISSFYEQNVWSKVNILLDLPTPQALEICLTLRRYEIDDLSKGIIEGYISAIAQHHMNAFAIHLVDHVPPSI